MSKEIIDRLRNDEDYYGDYGNKFLSNSHIGKLLKNPMSLYDKTPNNPNFLVGGYFHTAILEPDKIKSFKVIESSTRNTKKYKEISGGELCLLQHEVDGIELMVDKMMANDICRDLIQPDNGSVVYEEPGITNLFADPYYAGGGIHKVKSGGHLNIHTDYMLHPVKPWYRRINLLLYLTPDWRYEWGGKFEMWNEECTERIQDVSPVQNRCVIFNTTSKSFHGHPRPLKTPKNINRWSIALYYFTLNAPEGEEEHKTAQWRYV